MISSRDPIRFVFGRAGVTNPIGELGTQLFVAKLNIARGSDPRPIRDARIAADIFLATHNWQDWDLISKSERRAIVEWVATLTAYNEGRLGVGACGAPPPPPTGDACTRTIGYWKNHAGFGPQGDVVTPLLPLWLGTSGASGSAVLQTITQADLFLATHAAADWSSLSSAQRQQVLAWAAVLDDYNNGRIGPTHCG